MNVRFRMCVAGVGLAVLALSALLGAQGTGSQAKPAQAKGQKPASSAVAASTGIKADYERAMGLRDRLQNTIVNVAEAPSWVGTTTKFWYRKSVKGGNQFVVVDAAAATKAPAFDHTRLAAAISAAAQGKYTDVTLPFSTFTFSDDMQAIDFTIGGGARGAGGGGGGTGPAAAGAAALPRWRCTLTTYECTRRPAPADSAAAGQGRGGRGATPAPGAPASDQPQVRVSPDGKSEVLVQNFNIFLRPAGSASAPAPIAPGPTPQPAPAAPRAVPLTWDGSEGDAYTFSSIVWSPDSKKIAAYRRRPGYRRMVNYVQSSPADQLQPKLDSRYYQKPGDVVDLDQPVLVDVATKRAVAIDSALFPNPYSNGRIEWRKDNRAFTFEYNQRGHQVYRVIEVDAATGAARTVVEETSKAFVDYRRPTAGLSDSGRTYRYDVADGREVIWMSERDGWSHLYLYDGATGRVKNQITKGNWRVHFVERVDEEARQIWFTANGMDAGKDPYFLHVFRINFDGTGLTRFTTADAMHTVTWSPKRDYYVDSYSRVDQPPVSELRRTSDGFWILPRWPLFGNRTSAGKSGNTPNGCSASCRLRCDFPRRIWLGCTHCRAEAPGWRATWNRRRPARAAAIGRTILWWFKGLSIWR